MAWDHIERRPATNPFALADGKTPCLVIGWERGHGDMPAEWDARVIYATPDGPMETLIPARRIKGVGLDDPAVRLYVEHFASRQVQPDSGRDGPGQPAG